MKPLLPLAVLLALAAPLPAQTAPDPSPGTGTDDGGIRVAACDAKVPSRKRGVGMNKLSEADFRALAPGVSWYYNWHYKTDSLPPADAPMEFVPQAWANRPEDVVGLDAYLGSVARKPRVVLAINEPNLKGQAFIPPQTTAELFLKIKAVADKYHLPVVGPNMALGSGGNDSIKAFDPIENKEVTYTFFVPFVKAFFSFLGSPDPVDGIGLHSYGNIGELKWATGEMYKQFNKPVWMTEYAQWKTNGMDDAVNYLVQATDFLEANPNVGGYAWFKERADNPSISLLVPKADGQLTPLGQAYVALPPHDAQLYYRIPGVLPAANYVTAADAAIRLSTDGDVSAPLPGRGFDMAGGANAAATYNLQVDAAGTYTVVFRAMGKPGPIEIQDKDGRTLGTATTASAAWDQAQASVALPAGPQTIQVKFPGQALHAIEFKP